MDGILYNMRFRKECNDALLSIFLRHGTQTGSSLIPDYDHSDIDIAVMCDDSFIQELDQHIQKVDYNENDVVVSYTQSLTHMQKLEDASQYVFDVLLKGSYSLYRKDSYRDSTFLSCYVYNRDDMYNLLLMDEPNVYAEWLYATHTLRSNCNLLDLREKYHRIKFFEYHRKTFRRMLALP